MKPTVGSVYTCVASKSRFYIQGKDYVTELDSSGKLCVRGEDGMLDPLGKTISTFKLKSQGLKNE